MLVQVQPRALQRTQETVHREMEGRIIELHRPQEAIYRNLRRKLLPDLAHQRLLRALSGLHLSARKLPPILPVAIPSLGGENPAFLTDYCRDYLNLVHCDTQR